MIMRNESNFSKSTELSRYWVIIPLASIFLPYSIIRNYGIRIQFILN